MKRSNPNAHSDAWRLSVEEDVGGLQKLLANSTSETDRFLSARFLGDARLRSANSVTYLMAALQDPSTDVRIAAIKSLGELKASDASGQLLRMALDDGEDGVIRDWAATSLATLEDPRVTPFLEARLSTSDRHRRRWAAELLGKVGTRSSIAALEDARKRDSVFRRRSYNRAIEACLSRR